MALPHSLELKFGDCRVGFYVRRANQLWIGVAEYGALLVPIIVDGNRTRLLRPRARPLSQLGEPLRIIVDDRMYHAR